MRHIFTSPSSAYGGETRATCTCNAALHNMTMVEAAHIAYGCLQVQFLQTYILTSRSILFRFVLVSALRTLGPKSMVLSTTGNSTTTSSSLLKIHLIRSGKKTFSKLGMCKFFYILKVRANPDLSKKTIQEQGGL